MDSIIRVDSFKDIDIHLPKLKYLSIDITECEIRDIALNSLSKLKKLQTIEFLSILDYFSTKYLMPSVTYLSFYKVINNCPEIKSIICKRDQI